MPPLTSTQKATLNQFMAITGLTEKGATKFLKSTGWKLDLAANSAKVSMVNEADFYSYPNCIVKIKQLLYNVDVDYAIHNARSSKTGCYFQLGSRLGLSDHGAFRSSLGYADEDYLPLSLTEAKELEANSQYRQYLHPNYEVVNNLGTAGPMNDKQGDSILYLSGSPMSQQALVLEGGHIPTPVLKELGIHPKLGPKQSRFLKLFKETVARRCSESDSSAFDDNSHNCASAPPENHLDASVKKASSHDPFGDRLSPGQNRTRSSSSKSSNDIESPPILQHPRPRSGLIAAFPIALETIAMGKDTLVSTPSRQSPPTFIPKESNSSISFSSGSSSASDLFDQGAPVIMFEGSEERALRLRQNSSAGPPSADYEIISMPSPLKQYYLEAKLSPIRLDTQTRSSSSNASRLSRSDGLLVVSPPVLTSIKYEKSQIKIGEVLERLSDQLKDLHPISLAHRRTMDRINFIRIEPNLANSESPSFYESNGVPPQNTKEVESLGKLFDEYRANNDEAINVDGMMKYFGDLGCDLESVEILVPVEIVQTPAMGIITKDGFVDGWKGTGADTISKQKAYIASQTKKLSTDFELFKRVYKHTFVFSKETPDQKAMPLEQALVYWSLLFNSPSKAWITPTTNWIELWSEFLNAKWTKTVNKDMWNQTFEFFRKTLDDETLGFWSEDGAWPGVIDDFVAYVKEKRGDAPETMETD